MLRLSFRSLALQLDLEQSPLLVRCRTRLYRELAARGLKFRPHLWLSDEWFCPDGVPGFAVPFYLARPDLIRLERAQVGFAEGATPAQCLRLMRHETGHAVENAFRLKRDPDREDLFGKSATPYPKHYRPLAHSRRFVRHLGDGYAQSHPDEDFAETFAVWLRDAPSVWRRRYRGWPALEKLEGMDRLLRRIGASAPKVKHRRTIAPLESLRRKLETHYAKRRAHYGTERLAPLDSILRRMMPRGPCEMTGDDLLRKIGRAARDEAARRAGVPRYTVDRLLTESARRARALGLRGIPDTALLTRKYLSRGLHQIPL